MNVLGSHDRVRILNAMAGYDQEGIAQMDRAEAAHIRLTPEQREAAQAKVLEAFRLLCALPGAPTVYYGDELGMEGMADPWNRAPMAWDKGDKAVRRAFMAGALEALQRIKHGADRDALLRECVDYGRTVGSKVETAR